MKQLFSELSNLGSRDSDKTQRQFHSTENDGMEYFLYHLVDKIQANTKIVRESFLKWRSKLSHLHKNEIHKRN